MKSAIELLEANGTESTTGPYTPMIPETWLQRHFSLSLLNERAVLGLRQVSQDKEGGELAATEARQVASSGDSRKVLGGMKKLGREDDDKLPPSE